MADKDILLAKIGAPNGVRGEVRVKAFGEADLLDGYGTLYDATGQRYEIERMRPHKGVLIVRFKGIDTREAAEALNGRELFVSRDALPETEEDEYYLSDLIGLDVVSPSGMAIGRVRAVDNYGAGDVIEIKMLSGKSELFVFTRDNFPKIDISAGKIVFNQPESVSERES